MSAPPLFRIGVVADPQYADKDDGDTEGRCQRYRSAPAALRLALEALRAQEPPLHSVLSLGDIIDGAESEAQSAADLELIAGLYDSILQVPTRHVIGNHCLSVPRQALAARLRVPSPGYYTVALPAAWRLVVLDTTDLSGHSGHPEGSAQAQEAAAYWAAHPASEEEPQMVVWNGGPSRAQLAWLAEALAAAQAAGERVIVASHHPLGGGAPGSARRTHLAWNWKDVEATLCASPAVALALAGHDHVGGYGAAPGGPHFVTVQAVLEAPQGSTAYAVLEVYRDRVEVLGGGTVPSRTLALQ